MEQGYPLFYTFHFYLFGILAVASALLFVTRKSPVAAALWLVSTMFSLAAMYVMLDAHFIGAIQVLVYAGAIMVVFLFVIMLVRPEDLGELRSGSRVQTVIAWILGLALFGEVASVISTGILTGQRGTQTPAEIAAAGGNTQALGRILYSQYLLPFEVASLVLIAALVGAIAIGRPDRPEPEEQP